MIKPKPSDIGRGVVYCPAHGSREDGIITSLNESADYVFVLYRGDSGSKLTCCRDLEWLSEERKDTHD